METNNEKLYTLSSNVTPVMPIHPGEILGEELKARGISQKEFAVKAGMQATHLSAIIHGVRNITPAVAQKLEMALDGINAASWTKLQEQYNRDINSRKRRLPALISGYENATPNVAILAQEESQPYAGHYTVTVTIPEKDKALLYQMAERLGWIID
jgi:addiction module HigA family antidote